MQRDEVHAKLNSIEKHAYAMVNKQSDKAVELFDLAIQDMRAMVDAIYLTRTAAAVAARVRRTELSEYVLHWRSSDEKETFSTLEAVAERVRLKPGSLKAYLSKGKGRHTMFLLRDEADTEGDNVTIRRIINVPKPPVREPTQLPERDENNVVQLNKAAQVRERDYRE